MPLTLLPGDGTHPSIVSSQLRMPSCSAGSSVKIKSSQKLNQLLHVAQTIFHSLPTQFTGVLVRLLICVHLYTRQELWCKRSTMSHLKSRAPLQVRTLSYRYHRRPVNGLGPDLNRAQCVGQDHLDALPMILSNFTLPFIICQSPNHGGCSSIRQMKVF